ncbi:MAG: response regulator [Sphingomonadales bacterium]|nr:MAG: response regulator [Sphingomonadales bacterium]
MSEGLTAFERAVRDTNWRFRLLGILALLGIGVLAALIIVQQRTDNARDRAIALQQYTFEVIIRANQLSGAIASAEAALGRYVVSADKSLGRQYTAQWSRAGEQLNRLKQLANGNPAQQRQLIDLQRAFDARGKELSDTALYSAYGRHRDAWGSYYNVRQSDARASLEKMAADVVAGERVLLAQRTRDAAELIRNSSIASRILTGFGILIVLGAVLLGWMAIEAEGERAVADADASAERERAHELQQAVAGATAQLRAEVHERIVAEEQLRQAQKMEAVGQLTGGIAHDFNNMLAVVLGGLELAKRQVSSGGADAARHIDNAMEGANRAAALTRRLLAFSRSEPLLPEAVEPAALIGGMTDLLDRTLGDGIEVDTIADDGNWRVWADRHQLENALLNLAVNARDAMNGRGTLTISANGCLLQAGEVGTCEAGDHVAITVADTGCGMTQEVLDRVYEPFFTTKPVGQGTGLGLSQIFGFVRQSGGEIAIATAPGKGTAVTLYLPRFAGETSALPVPHVLPAASASRTSLTILVVEDDPRVLAATVAALQELGHRVTGCADPLDAPSAVDGLEGLDIVVSDVLMPGQTGPEMIAALGPVTAGVAVLFVTGFAGEVDAAIFRGRPVLRKPFTMAALSQAVDDAVEAEAQNSPRAA